jgi:hypothetical protein
LETLVPYLKSDPSGNLGPGWTWWCWNPNSGDTGGILKDDWISVNQQKVDELKPIQFVFPGAGLTPGAFSPRAGAIPLASSPAVLAPAPGEDRARETIHSSSPGSAEGFGDAIPTGHRTQSLALVDPLALDVLTVMGPGRFLDPFADSP